MFDTMVDTFDVSFRVDLLQGTATSFLGIHDAPLVAAPVATFRSKRYPIDRILLYCWVSDDRLFLGFKKVNL